MRRHTPLCKTIARSLNRGATYLDPGYNCLDLDAAIRSLGLSWRELDMTMLVEVIEAAGLGSGTSDEDRYRQALLARL